jgi:hypothetical protein
MEKQHNFLRWILDGRERNVWSYGDEDKNAKPNGRSNGRGKS